MKSSTTHSDDLTKVAPEKRNGKSIFRFIVSPGLPRRLKPLMDIAYNLWWTWTPSAISLFQRVDEAQWEASHHNPIQMLGHITQERIEALLSDEAFQDHMHHVHKELEEYMIESTWYRRLHADKLENFIAYFSAEFGLAECIPLYSGGLGVLAGDHAKAASELGLPFVGMTLLYQDGYFQQRVNRLGHQEEHFIEHDFFNMPMKLELDDEGAPITIAVDFPGRKVQARVWRIQVGRVPIFLLDTNVEGNTPEDRRIAARLYGSGKETRVQQEMMLGVGGLRALRRMGISPTVCHMNEGHSAFLALERIRLMMINENLSFEEARGVVTATNVFTTHTPVPAGNDVFAADLVSKYLKPYQDDLGLPCEDILDFGREMPGMKKEPFCMTVLALRFATRANAVSRLHGQVSRHMWRKLWPQLPESEAPIIHITNGVYTQGWLATEFSHLYRRYLGFDWVSSPVDQDRWARVENIPDVELWATRNRMRERLVGQARRRLSGHLRRRFSEGDKMVEVSQILHPGALTIGFARRFATYKRATLILSDLERLDRILNDPHRPVQIVFAGKAHPDDEGGKKYIRDIFQVLTSDRFRNRIVFLEDYDIEVAKMLVQGVDVWLNTPRRPQEASGTSGMKAAINGALNLSVLDGWWCEAYDMSNGWAIGNGDEHTDPEHQDELESTALYDLLENEVAPLFYNRDRNGLPARWVAMMKRSIQTICPVFNTTRMVEEYTEKLYLPAVLEWNWLSANEMEQSRALAEWASHMRLNWHEVEIRDVTAESPNGLEVGTRLSVQALVSMGGLGQENISVELLHGPMGNNGEINFDQVATMTMDSEMEGGLFRFQGEVACHQSGQHGFAVRIVPNTELMGRRLDLGLVKWW